MSPGTLHGAVVSGALVPAVLFVSLLYPGDWASVFRPSQA